MHNNILMVPGYKGSPSGHWQTWLQQQYPHARRIDDIKHDQPLLAVWAQLISDYLHLQTQPVTVVAHSFGCLAASLAIHRYPHKVHAALLVAPASPERFTVHGHIGDFPSSATIADAIPKQPLGIRGTVVASQNDPWITYQQASQLCSKWGLTLYNAGTAGHINIESGHGPAPGLQRLLNQLMATLPATASQAGPPYEPHRTSRKIDKEKPRYLTDF